ncbi:MAG: nuclear transport factor 2 family protein [Gammaproteobacteria bacterium]|nr:nuclear transport factor 2 family protein [Gammaproteobacteria bacterium]
MQADDYFAIQNLLFSYPYALDRGDFDAVGQLFRHAEVYSGGALMASKDAEKVAASFRDWVLTYGGYPRTRHMLANVVIEPEGEDRATVRSYVMVFQQTEALPLQPVIGGDYLDTVQKVDGQWRFVERRMGNDLVGNLSAHGRDFDTIKPHRAND